MIGVYVPPRFAVLGHDKARGGKSYDKAAMTPLVALKLHIW